MTVDSPKGDAQRSGLDGPAAAQLVEKLAHWDGSAEEFLGGLLSVYCFLGQADGGAILCDTDAGTPGVVAVYPPRASGGIDASWLAESGGLVRETLSAGGTVIRPLLEPDHLYGQPPKRCILAVPLTVARVGQAVVAFVMENSGKAVLEARLERIELASTLVALCERRVDLQEERSGLNRLRRAMETLSAVNRQRRFTGAAMAFCNAVASQWECERASIGFLKGRYVRLKAMSRTEHFSRKMRMVHDIEHAMEECLDQDMEVTYPPGEDSTCVCRAATELSRQHGPLCVLSLPLRGEEGPVAVVTLEREAGHGFSAEEIETVRLACELCTARLLDLSEHDRWIGKKALARIRSTLATLVGPTHTWAKVAALLITAAVAFMVFAKGEFRVTAPCVLETSRLQVVPAPFDGYIKSVHVEIGEPVKANETVLAELDTAELRLQLAAKKAERTGYLKQASAAMRDGQTANAQIARASADKAAAEIELLEHLLSRASITVPIDGIVLAGDLKRNVGRPVATGDVLFEVAPLDSLRAELLVPEDEICDVVVGGEGHLATASYPGQRIRFAVAQINPVAEVVKQRNVFRVRVRLLDTHGWMRPGMEGVAKASVGRRRYIWIWTRKVVNWIRMKLWL